MFGFMRAHFIRTTALTTQWAFENNILQLKCPKIVKNHELKFATQFYKIELPFSNKRTIKFNQKTIFYIICNLSQSLLCHEQLCPEMSVMLNAAKTNVDIRTCRDKQKRTTMRASERENGECFNHKSVSCCVTVRDLLWFVVIGCDSDGEYGWMR